MNAQPTDTAGMSAAGSGIAPEICSSANRSTRARAAASHFVILRVAVLTVGSGLLNIYSVIGPGLPDRIAILKQFLPLEIVNYSRFLVLLSGFALVAASINIVRRKRRAWKLVMALALASIVLHLSKGIDYEEACLSLLLMLLLWLVRGSFSVRSRDVNWRAAVLKAGMVASLAVAYGVLGFWLLKPVEFGRNFDWAQSIKQTLLLLTFDHSSMLVARTWYARWFLESLNLISVVILLFSVWSLFRPVLYRFRTHPAEAEEARHIVERCGRTAQDFFKFGADKSFFFSESRLSFLAYRVGADFAVVLGDPVGPRTEIDQVVRSFLSYCRDNGWHVAFHQATPEFLPVYECLGLHRLKVGDEAIVRLDQLTLEGKAAKSLRSTLNHFDKAGITAVFYTAPVPENALDQAEAVSAEWLQIPGRRERQFTLGRFDRAYLRGTELLAAVEPDGRMLGFVNFIPSYRSGEATLDLMRRRTDGPNGIMDYLLLRAFLIARERGYQRFNLGLAPMSGFHPDEQSSAEERALHAFFQQLSFVFSFQGLKAYKAKFATEWEPRYVVYNSALHLPLLPLAIERVSELPKEE